MGNKVECDSCGELFSGKRYRGHSEFLIKYEVICKDCFEGEEFAVAERLEEENR